jgi:pimeloyl-ACP methyl ester carboxylesterase
VTTFTTSQAAHRGTVWCGVGSLRVRADLDPSAFPVEETSVRGFRQVFTRDGRGGVPAPARPRLAESRRIFWRVVAPLVAAGFEVIAPDLRGFGDSDVGPRRPPRRPGPQP